MSDNRYSISPEPTDLGSSTRESTKAKVKIAKEIAGAIKKTRDRVSTDRKSKMQVYGSCCIYGIALGISLLSILGKHGACVPTTEG